VVCIIIIIDALSPSPSPPHQPTVPSPRLAPTRAPAQTLHARRSSRPVTLGPRRFSPSLWLP